MEVAIAVTVGNGDDKEVFMGPALRGSQSLQGPVQLTLAGTLGLGSEQQNCSAEEKGRETKLGLQPGLQSWFQDRSKATEKPCLGKKRGSGEKQEG